MNVCRQGSSDAQNEIIIALSPRERIITVLLMSPSYLWCVSLLYFTVSKEMCSLSVKCVTLSHSLYEFIHPLVLILLVLKETLRLLTALRSFSPSVVSTLPSPLSHSIFLSLVHCLFCRSVLILSPWPLFIAGEERSLVAISVLTRLSVRVCVWDMFVRARHISLGWWWGICERVCVWRWGCVLSDAGSRVLAELRWWL